MKYLLFYLISFNFCFGQDLTPKTNMNIDTNLFYGNIIKHQPDVAPLIQGHPTGITLGISKSIKSKNKWEKNYNFPEIGGTFIYENYNSPYLGKVFFIGLHYNFYFFKRNLMFRIGQGVSYADNPYDKVKNNKNVAFGSNLMAGTIAMIQYKKGEIFDNFGIQAGLVFTHFSNGTTKAPNTGINSFGINAGIFYTFNEKINDFKYIKDTILFKEPIKYNISLKSGINESLPNIGQKTFLHLGFYADKRLNRKSAIQLGTDIFINKTRKEYINYSRIAYELDKEPIEEGVDYKRVGLILGHELFLNKMSFETQLGYYIYNPIIIEDEIIYARVGVKYYVTPKWFGSFHVKTHYFNAETLEFGIGVRL